MHLQKELNNKVKEQVKKIKEKMERDNKYEEYLIKKEKMTPYLLKGN